MTDLLSRLDGGELIGLVAVVGGLLVAMIAIIAGNWRRVRQAEIEASLKQDMLNRGMSAEDIAQVIRVSRKKSVKHCGNDSPKHVHHG